MRICLYQNKCIFKLEKYQVSKGDDLDLRECLLTHGCTE